MGMAVPGRAGLGAGVTEGVQPRRQLCLFCLGQLYETDLGWRACDSGYGVGNYGGELTWGGVAGFGHGDDDFGRRVAGHDRAQDSEIAEAEEQPRVDDGLNRLFDRRRLVSHGRGDPLICPQSSRSCPSSPWPPVR